MELNKKQLKLVYGKERYELESSTSATLEQYLDMVKTLSKKLDLYDVKFVNDFDSYYHIFKSSSKEIITSYNIYLGISIYIPNEANTDIQKDTLEKLNLLLEE